MAVVPQAMFNGSVSNLRLDSPEKYLDDDKSGLLLEEVCLNFLMDCLILSGYDCRNSNKIVPHNSCTKIVRSFCDIFTFA